MRRTLLLLLLSTGISFSQTTTTPAVPTPPPSAAPTSFSGFVEAGAQSGNNITGGVGVAATVSAGNTIFLEVTDQTGAAPSAVADVLFGVKTDLPKVKGFTPFTIVAFGGAISSFSKLTTVPTGVTGVNTASVTALGNAVGFAQKYGGGFQYPVNGFNVGFGVQTDKSTTSAWKGYPFIFIGKQF
jgi:hypothetical protein